MILSDKEDELVGFSRVKIRASDSTYEEESDSSTDLPDQLVAMNYCTAVRLLWGIVMLLLGVDEETRKAMVTYISTRTSDEILNTARRVEKTPKFDKGSPGALTRSLAAELDSVVPVITHAFSSNLFGKATSQFLLDKARNNLR